MQGISASEAIRRRARVRQGRWQMAVLAGGDPEATMMCSTVAVAFSQSMTLQASLPFGLERGVQDGRDPTD